MVWNLVKEAPIRRSISCRRVGINFNSQHRGKTIKRWKNIKVQIDGPCHPWIKKWYSKSNINAYRGTNKKSKTKGVKIYLNYEILYINSNVNIKNWESPTWVWKSTHLPNIHCISKQLIRSNKILHRFMDFPETPKITHQKGWTQEENQS